MAVFCSFWCNSDNFDCFAQLICVCFECVACPVIYKKKNGTVVRLKNIFEPFLDFFLCNFLWRCLGQNMVSLTRELIVSLFTFGRTNIEECKRPSADMRCWMVKAYMVALHCWTAIAKIFFYYVPKILRRAFKDWNHNDQCHRHQTERKIFRVLRLL